MKKKTKRSRSKYPALDPSLNLRSRYEQNDYDYLDKLNPEELTWLNSFTSEWLHNDFYHEGERVHPEKFDKKYIKANKKYKKYDVYKKESSDANNARNRDILTREKAKGTYLALEDLKKTETKENVEDLLIAKIDEEYPEF